MQYPEIQFYRGSLVRLASGQLKQVEDLSSDDFLESARLIQRRKQPSMQQNAGTNSQSNQANNKKNQRQFTGSALNSPSSGDSPTMDMDYDDQEEEDDDDDDEELDVVSPVEPELFKASLLANNNKSNTPLNHQTNYTNQDDDQDIHIDSSVVRDFLEVNNNSHLSQPSTSQLSPSFGNGQQQATSVLIKFFLESSRSVVFIEVPIEHPFFVFHRGWSSWNPQRTYDKFGLKCRKLKIGDTCISLIRKQQPVKQQAPFQLQHQDNSDQCNILFSSIKITS